MRMIPVKRNEGWFPEIFNDFFDTNWMLKANATAPAINVIENDKDYKVEVAAPGMTKDDFKVTLGADNNLLIEMEKRVKRKTRIRKTESSCVVSSLIQSLNKPFCCRTMWRKTKSLPK